MDFQRLSFVGLLAACCLVLPSACAVNSAQTNQISAQIVPQAVSPNEGKAEPGGIPGRPAIMVVLRDVPREEIASVTDQMLQVGTNETLLVQAFESRGFPAVSEAAVSQALQNDELRRILEGDDQAASAVGQRLASEVVVAGTAVESKTKRIAGGAALDFYRIELSVRAVDVATARPLGTSEMLLESRSADSTRQEAADSAADELAARILANWQVPSNITEIYADNADYRRVELLKSTIKSLVSGVVSVATRSLEERTAVVEVVTEEPSQQVLAQMDRCTTAVPFAFKGIEGNRIDIQFLDVPASCKPVLK